MKNEPPVKCIIVDDEPLQQEILIEYISGLEGFELAACFDNGLQAIDYLKTNKVDLMFLDINMPGINGIDLVKRLINPPAIIFTTAYAKFAVDGFNLNAIDYLLKPISYDRFVQAIGKFQLKSGLISPENIDSILVKSGKKEYRIRICTIHYIESMGDYVRMVTDTQGIITHGTLVQFLDILPAAQFCRIHKSFIVNLEMIDFLEGNMISLKGKKLSVGKTYKEGFLDSWRNVETPS